MAFFIAEEQFEKAVNVLREAKAAIVRPVKRGTGWTVNFLDPNGIQFELHTSKLDDRMNVWQ